MRTLVLTLLLGLAAILAAGMSAHANAPSLPPVKAVYHVDADNDGTIAALHHVKNQLTADPTARIVVVTIGKSVRFLVKDAETKGGYPYALMIQDLQERGVRFEACGNTMKTLKIERDQLDDGVKVVPSGMDELARLQSREGYAYIKP